MEFKHTLEILHLQVKEIADMIENFEKSGKVPLIEFDILLEKFRNIYDLSSELRSAIIREQHQKETNGAEVNQTIEKPLPVKEIENPSPELKKSPPANENDNKFVSDRFKGAQHILHDDISEKNKYDDVSTKYKSKPISSIKSGLSLSEKFELINQLFKGNKEKFEHTMGVLESADSFVEACNYIESHFNWDMNDVYVQRVLELIRRKLIIGHNEK